MTRPGLGAGPSENTEGTGYMSSKPGDKLTKRKVLVFFQYKKIHNLMNLEHSWHSVFTAVQTVFNPFSQFVPQLELYSQLQLSRWSDPIASSVPKPT